jgi:thymidylate kinase
MPTLSPDDTNGANVNEHSKGDSNGCATAVLGALPANGHARSEPRLTSSEPIPLVRKLCETLESHHISYCHWKSNWRLDRWLRGEGDLDLLVARTDAQRFAGILGQLGFKLALRSPAEEIPGILNYFGYDSETNRFVHLHVHFQIVIGHDWTKNYHLPIEHAILESAVRQGPIPVPATEIELIVFVIRMVLKCSLLEMGLSQRARRRTSVYDELEYLEKYADWGELIRQLRRHLPCIEAELFRKCVDSLRPEASVWQRVAIRRKLQRVLRAHSRRPNLPCTFWAAARQLVAHLKPRSSGQRPATGGVIIALVGGDGSGKSTCVNELHSWVSKNFKTCRVHLGKPPRSLFTLAVALTRRAIILVNKLLRRGTGIATATPGHESGIPQCLPWLRSVSIARDRYRLYRKARRFATHGGLVICDRYPTPGIKSMDGPNLTLFGDTAPPRLLAGFLSRVEAFYYRRILPPDLLIVLKIDPELAVRRKPEEDAAYVRARNQEVWELDFREHRAHVIGTNRPRADVLSDLRTIVWSAI